ncbi:HNH endonuclease [Ruegeria phage RpAliso]|nr:HNH endonuclease [Ruegeria phage RpAliso]
MTQKNGNRTTAPTVEDFKTVERWFRRLPKPRCPYCGVKMDHENPDTAPTRDHIWTKRVRTAMPGLYQIIVCCRTCNAEKADMLPSEWEAYCREHKPRPLTRAVRKVVAFFTAKKETQNA